MTKPILPTRQPTLFSLQDYFALSDLERRQFLMGQGKFEPRSKDSPTPRKTADFTMDRSPSSTLRQRRTP